MSLTIRSTMNNQAAAQGLNDAGKRVYGHLAQVPGGQGPSQQSEHVHADGKMPPLLRGRPVARAAVRR